MNVSPERIEEMREGLFANTTNPQVRADFINLAAALREAQADYERLREALNLALMHLEDPRAVAAVRAALAPADEAKLLAEDHSEIREVPAAVRDVWEKRPGRAYTREDYLRDKAARDNRDAPADEAKR